MRSVSFYSAAALAVIAGFTSLLADSVVWEHKDSGTVALLRGSSVTITSRKHAYKLVLPYAGMQSEYGWSWTTPLRVRTEDYVAVVREQPREGASAADFLRASLQSLKSDQNLHIEQEEILEDESRPILRYLVMLRTVPDVIEEPNYWRWNYLTAIPKPDSWLVLHLSSARKAKRGKAPRDTKFIEILRAGFTYALDETSNYSVNPPAVGASSLPFASDGGDAWVEQIEAPATGERAR